MKKKLLFLILLSIISQFGFTQIILRPENRLSDTLSYQENYDYFIKNIDKTIFTTNILYDRVVPLARLLSFNPLAPKDTSNYAHFIQSYYEIYSASFNNSSMKSYTDIEDEASHKKNSSGFVPIGVIDFNFNSLDSNALRNGTLGVTNKQLTILKSNIVFTLNTEACILSLLSENLKVGVNRIAFDPNFIFTNTNITINSIELNFGNEYGILTLLPSETKEINILNTSPIVLTYKIILSNGKLLKGYTTIQAETPDYTKGLSYIAFCDSLRIVSKTPYQINSHQELPGSFADVLIYYSNCNEKTIKKPIIICDGFDPDDSRKGNQIYRLMNFDFQLADSLRFKGFDIIIVNFPQGADYIGRNANTMIDVINWVNQNKVTNKKNIVVGPSMGGLITRYALAKMEKNGVDHQTLLWISFDAPHQGANIAIGDQYFLDFFGRTVNNAAAKKGLDKINSIAAKQMLIDHYQYKSTERPQCNFLRTSFISELTNNGLPNSNGYPQNLRKVALINGSGTATLQEGIYNNEYLLEMDVYQDLLLVSLQVAHAEIKTSADLSYIRKSVFYGFCADKNNVGYYWNRQNWSRPSTSPYYTTSYDVAPGGNYPTQKILAGKNKDFKVHYPSHSFIPSVSSLDLKDPYLTLNIANSNIIGTKRTPFDAYYAPNENQEHITFTSESISWIKKEIFTTIPCLNRTINSVTYSSNATISDCKISLSNIVITNNANVVFDSESELNITGTFEVSLGSSIELK